MKNQHLTLLLLLLVFTGIRCQSKKEMEVEKEISCFQKNNTVEFELQPKQFSRMLYSQTVDSALLWLDRATNKIHFYTNSIGQHYKTLEFPFDGPNGVGKIQSFFYKNPDSIFIFPYQRAEIFIVNEQIQLVDKIKLPENFEVYARNHSPIYEYRGNLLIPIINNNSAPDNIPVEFSYRGVLLNLEKKDYVLFNKLPEYLIEQKFLFPHQSFSWALVSNKLFISYSSSEFIDVWNIENDSVSFQNSIQMELKHKLAGPYKGDMNDFMETKKFTLKENSFSGLFKITDLYFGRIFRKGLADDKLKAALSAVTPIFGEEDLQIFNSDGEFVSSISLKDYNLNTSEYFVYNGIIYFKKNEDEKEDSETFSSFIYNCK
jgi:hypothetical protein